MITSKIKALFQFIEFLHSNTENFKQFDSTINELYLLDIERKKLSPRKNFAEKMKYDEVQAEIKDKFKVIQENIIQPINSKVLELNICDMNKTETLNNWNISEISDLINNCKKEDLPEIFKHKSKYLEFRTKTNCTYFKDFFFDDLDEMLKELFDYFKETEHNEFEAFETKAIQVNDFREMAEHYQKGHKNFTLPIDLLLNHSKIQRINNENLLPHQTETNPEQTETLSDLITHKNSVEIIESIKIQYRNIKGKRLKLLLIAFQDMGLLPKERIAKKFHECCLIEFDWDIASYNAMNGYNYNENTDKDELNSMKKYLETLTKQK